MTEPEDADVVAARTAALQSLLPRAMEAGRAGFWNYDVGEDRLMYCAVVAPLYGLPIDRRFMGVPMARIAERVHPGDLEEFGRRLARLRRHGGRIDVSYRTVPADDAVRLVTVRGAWMTDASGRSVQACGIVLDMTSEPVPSVEASATFAGLDRLGTDVALDQAILLGLACRRAVYAIKSTGSLPAAIDALLLELGRQIASELGRR